MDRNTILCECVYMLARYAQGFDICGIEVLLAAIADSQVYRELDADTQQELDAYCEEYLPKKEQ